MVGSEESVPAVQHARLAARPAGREHRSASADTAASARHREPGVAEAKPLVQHTTDTGTQHIRHSCPHLYRYTLVWVCGQTEGPGVNTQILTKRVNLLLPSPLLSAMVHKKDFLISALTDNQWTLCFFFLRTMKKCWSRRRLLDQDFGRYRSHNQSTFLGTPANDQEEEKYKSQELQHTQKYMISFLNKHFTRSQTLITCDRNSKLCFIFYLYYFCVKYRTTWVFIFNLFLNKRRRSQRDNNTNVSRCQEIWTVLCVLIAHTLTHLHNKAQREPQNLMSD